MFLKNYRCFESLELNFQQVNTNGSSNLHVLLAPNMIGKSAVIKALRIVIGTRLQKIKIDAAPDNVLGISKEDHRVIGANPLADRAREVIVEATCTSMSWQSDWKESSYVFRKYKEDYLDKNTKIEHEKGNIVSDANSAFNRVIEKKDGILPLLLYVGTEYIHQQKPPKDLYTDEESAKQGYLHCLDDLNMESYVFDWLERLYRISLEQKRSTLALQLYENLAIDTLSTFKKALNAILPDVTELDWVRDISGRGVRDYLLTFNIEGQGIRTYEMLSDGYKYLVLLVGELVLRSTLLNKHLGQDVLNDINGVVLIDEFGIHLHPNLQSEALSRLAELIPNVQFIITTHSPMIVNGLLKEQIYIIEANGNGERFVLHPDDDAIGLGAEGILREMFNMDTTFDERVLAMSDEYKRLISEKNRGNLDLSDNGRLKNLSFELSKFRLDPSLDIGAKDPISELVKARITESKNIVKRSALTNDDMKGLELRVNNILDDLFRTE